MPHDLRAVRLESELVEMREKSDNDVKTLQAQLLQTQKEGLEYEAKYAAYALCFGSSYLSDVYRLTDFMQANLSYPPTSQNTHPFVRHTTPSSPPTLLFKDASQFSNH